MKSLRESLFDRDLVKKDLVFGNFYEHSPGAERVVSLFKKNIVKWSKKSLFKDTGETDPYKALAKVIANISIDHRKDFENELHKILVRKYWKDGYDPILKVSSDVNRYYVDDVLDSNINRIIISFNLFDYFFERKVNG